jgi:hypothetical protein
MNQVGNCEVGNPEVGLTALRRDRRCEQPFVINPEHHRNALVKIPCEYLGYFS